MISSDTIYTVQCHVRARCNAATTHAGKKKNCCCRLWTVEPSIIFISTSFFFVNFFGVSLFIKLVTERMARYASFADVLRKYDITPAKRAKLNDEVHHLMPELTHYFNSLQARQLKGEVIVRTDLSRAFG